MQYMRSQFAVYAAFILLGLTGCEVGVLRDARSQLQTLLQLGTSFHLPRIVGSSVASEMLMTGRFIDADRALRVRELKSRQTARIRDCLCAV